MTTDEKYMYRCIELARKGAGYVAPNPMVGAVLVQDDRIIGEGWHQRYGEAHAEVGAIGEATGLATLSGLTSSFSSNTTLYVSLEPCAHHGKDSSLCRSDHPHRNSQGGDWLPGSF